MLHKNEEYEGLVEGLGTDGEGIIKTEGTTTFVPFCLTGERVRFKVLKVKGNIAYGKLIEVLTPSYARVKPVCPVFGKCGGCDLQHMSYAGQLEFKKESVKTALNKIGGIYVAVNDAVPSDLRYGYRNKLALPAGADDGGNIRTGFYARHSHRIVATDTCAIQSPRSEEVISIANEFAKTYSGRHMRHLVAREIDGKYIFALVADKNVSLDGLAALLEKRFEKFTLLLNINPSDTNVIFGEEWRICRGEGFFEGEAEGIKFKAGANTFIQVNDGVREKLYKRVLAEVGDGVAIDLYSGGGLLTAMLAKKCGAAYGIEIVKEASRCADELKEANGLSGKMHNICGSVEGNIDKVFEMTAGQKRVIVFDPPRKGMERSVVKAIARSGADKVVLISCNPATLARDLGILCGTLKEKDGALVKADCPASDYKIDSVTPFDMFPQTKWCETLVVLSHKKPDGHINIKVEFGEEEGQVSLKEVAKRAEKRKPKEKQLTR